MSTVKRIDGDYQIVTLNSQDNVTIQTHTVAVKGNLDVVGNLTYINVSELNIRDPFIVLNSSNTGSYESNAGILTHQTDTTFAGLRYNDNSGQWEISVDTGASGETGVWEQIATANLAATAAGSNTEIQYNQAGVLGASSNFTYDYAGNRLTVDGSQTFANIAVAPTAIANSVTVYHQGVGSGGSGVRVKTDTVDDELVTRSKAIVFGLIF